MTIILYNPSPKPTEARYSFRYIVAKDWQGDGNSMQVCVLNWVRVKESTDAKRYSV